MGSHHEVKSLVHSFISCSISTTIGIGLPSTPSETWIQLFQWRPGMLVVYITFWRKPLVRAASLVHPLHFNSCLPDIVRQANVSARCLALWFPCKLGGVICNTLHTCSCWLCVPLKGILLPCPQLPSMDTFNCLRYLALEGCCCSRHDVHGSVRHETCGTSWNKMHHLCTSSGETITTYPVRGIQYGFVREEDATRLPYRLPRDRDKFVLNEVDERNPYFFSYFALFLCEISNCSRSCKFIILSG